MLFLAGFLEHLQKGFLSNFLYVLSFMYHQEVRQREKTLISYVIPEQVQEASLLQIDCHVIIWKKSSQCNEIHCWCRVEGSLVAPSLCSLHHHPHLLIFLSTLHSSANTKIQSTQIQKIHSTQIHSKQIQNTQLTNTKHITLQPHHHPHLSISCQPFTFASSANTKIHICETTAC